MRIDDIRRNLNTQVAFARKLEDTFGALEVSSGILNAVQRQQGIIRYQEYLRVALGPLEDIRRSGYMDIVYKLHNETSYLNNLLVAEQRFLLPDLSYATKLLDDYAKTIQVDVLTRYSQQLSDLHSVVESIQTPWLDVENQIQSLNGLACLHGIGSLLRTLPPFDTKLTDILRVDLGDWREEVIWPSHIATDPFVRASLYDQQGFNPDLTMFPYPAFEEIVSETGLRGSDVLVAEDYVRDEELFELEEGAAFERTNNAHDRLQKFESRIRRFIDRHMKAQFGPNWITHRVPDDMRTRWRDRQRQDSSTQKWPLIAYADFADYTVIIIKRDNWRDLFKEFFINKSYVEESFRRLRPIRLATMHARLITQDDELFLYVETKRILSAIE